MGKLTLTGAVSGVGNASSYTVTAASGSAISKQITSTLVAAANNDILIGLQLTNTFTNGAFTGVSNYSIYANNTILTTGYFFGNGIVGNNVLQISSQGTNPIQFYTNSTGIERMRLFGSTGNLKLQNGGTFTDAGYRLDVVGADSRFNGIRAGLGAGQVANNTVFGNDALSSNVSGSGIVAVGYQALKSCTGSNNTAVGTQAGTVVSSGTENTLLGAGSGGSITTGSNNTAIGRSALLLNTASNNTALGFQSAAANTSGTGITAIGHQSLKASTGANNTAVGYQSLLTHTTGTNNTALGHLTVSGNFSGCLILGKDATATANNQFVVGSTGTIAGAVTTATAAQTKTWDVIINGVARKILLA
jgi:hypothetical protein